MAEFMAQANEIMGAINGVLWHEYVLFTVVAVGVLFTIWSGFSQYQALTHGVQVIRGKYDKKGDPGAINHFQALSAALSATVGLGNIGGVALAIALGGPGAVFWMWVIGFIGMALKTTEVTQSMLFRNTQDPDNPHGGPMWVVKKGFAKFKNPAMTMAGSAIGGIFCITLLISTVTGGNMFQAWNVGILTRTNFGIPEMVTGIVLCIVVALVIIGGIKRIGAVAGKLVPLMCALYVLAAGYVLFVNFDQIPAMLALIVKYAFSASEASGAFIGGTAGYAFLWGMKRALFSNEAGQGSAPIAHSAAKTDEPVREGVVAGLEPFIDTIVVCTLTALVILGSGAWNRGPEATYMDAPTVMKMENGSWTLNTYELPARTEEAKKISGDWREGNSVFVLMKNASGETERLSGQIIDMKDETGEDRLGVAWGNISSTARPKLQGPGIYGNYAGAALTSYAFDRVVPGLGTILVTLAAWLFAISTMISWSYYGEQGIVYLVGSRGVLPYKLIFCLLILVATSGLIKTDVELDNLTGLGTGVMLFANIPIMLIFGHFAMKKYHDYMRRLKSGKMKGHKIPDITEVVDGSNVE